MNDIDDLVELINQYIKHNGNQEITGEVENMILNAIVLVLVEYIGDKDTLNTEDKTTIVSAVNEVLALFQSNSVTVDEDMVKLIQPYPDIGIDGLLAVGATQMLFNEMIVNAFLKRSISGSITQDIITSNADIDLLSPVEQLNWTLKTNSQLSFLNMISNKESTVRSIILTGEFTLTMPSWLLPINGNDDYDGTILNQIVINITRGGTLSERRGFYTLQNIG